MARTKEAISLDAHAKSIIERLERIERNIELGELDQAYDSLLQAIGTLEAMRVKIEDIHAKIVELRYM